MNGAAFDDVDRNLEHIFEVLGKWTLTQDADELVETAQLMRLPWAKVAQPAFSAVPPVKMSVSPWKINLHLSGIGENNSEVYQGILGLSDTEIERLEKDVII